jgi:hypothetical protein
MLEDILRAIWDSRDGVFVWFFYLKIELTDDFSDKLHEGESSIEF